VDARVRARLVDWGIAWSVVGGSGDSRTEAALDALRPLLRRPPHAARPPGLFSRLEASRAGPPPPAWVCELCDDPLCERHARKARDAG
jgi:hypothetical protein